MVNTKRYTPTNKYFRNHFQQFASKKAKKGHLNNTGEDEEGAKNVNGIIVKIDKKKLYSDGWLVKVPTEDDKEYWCKWGDSGVISLPDCTESDSYYVPKKDTPVDVSIDEDNKVYTIIRMKAVDKTPIALYNDTLELSPDTNTDTNQDNKSKIEISKQDIKLKGEAIAESFKTNTLKVEEAVQTDTIVAANTVTGKINADGVRTESISFYDDKDPTIIPTSKGIGINKGVVTPKVFTNDIEGKTIKAETITLGDEDLLKKINKLEKRINDLENGG